MLIKPLIDQKVSQRIQQLIEEKKVLTEKDSSADYEDLRQFVEIQINEISQVELERTGCHDKYVIDDLFRRYI